MTKIVEKLRANAARRAEYRRIRNEIRAMPWSMALELDINPGDADRIAFDAVYGA